MPVSLDDVDELAAHVAAVYREAETALTRRITRQLAAGLDAPGWAEAKLAAVGDLRRAAARIIAGLGTDAGPAIRRAVAEAYRTGRGTALAELADRFSPHTDLGRQVRAARDQVPNTGAVEALARSVSGELAALHSSILRHTIDTYRDVVTGATARTLTGAQTRRQAAQSAWSALVDRGITGFTDRAGRRWQLSSYVEMAVRTVTQRAAVQGHTDALTATGQHYVIVGDASQECALCRPWEGRILALGDHPTGEVRMRHATDDARTVTVEVKATLEQARRAGLFHPNCRHSVSAYTPGITHPITDTADPAGDVARQRQRAIERRIRAWKARRDAALTDEGRKAACRRVRAWQAEMRQHLADHPDLKRLSYREQPGAGNIPRQRGDSAGPIAPNTQPTLDGGPAGRPPARPVADPAAERAAHAENDARDRAPGPGQAELDFTPPAGDPLAGLDLTALPDDQLADLLGEHVDNEAALNRITAEMDRRDQADDNGEVFGDPGELTAEERRIDELVARGYDYREAYAEVHDLDPDQLRREEKAALVDQQRWPGESRDDTVRRLYKEDTARRYLQAEEATRGNMLSKEGRVHGIDPRSLFGGTITRARKYASEELLQWFADHGRQTLVEYRADMLGREADIREAAKAKTRSNGQDFI